jgi:hypothetical protein
MGYLNLDELEEKTINDHYSKLSVGLSKKDLLVFASLWRSGFNQGHRKGLQDGNKDFNKDKDTYVFEVSED